MPLANQAYVAHVLTRLGRRRRPRVLYHYTSGSGLLGIVESKSIWATSVRYLNDSAEYALAVAAAEMILDHRASMARTPFKMGIYRVLKDSLKQGHETEVFVSSFSQNADQLSQWRGYCPAANGDSIGFTPAVLIMSNHELSYLAPCVYEEDAQYKLIESVIDDVVDFAVQFDRELPEHIDRVLRETFKLFEKLFPIVAPVVKDRRFEEEREWRLVSLASEFNPTETKVRAARSMLIPYIDHKLALDGERLQLSEIIVGPTPHAKLAKQSVELLMEKHQVKNAVIRNSEIPYRDW